MFNAHLPRTSLYRFIRYDVYGEKNLIPNARYERNQPYAEVGYYFTAFWYQRQIEFYGKQQLQNLQNPDQIRPNLVLDPHYIENNRNWSDSAICTIDGGITPVQAQSTCNKL